MTNRIRHQVYYTHPENITGDRVTILGDEFHHLVHVMRQQAGDSFLAIDGLGTAYECLITEVFSDRLQAVVLNKIEKMGEPDVRLSLVFALPKKDKIAWIIEKGTEIGVTEFQPVITEHTIVPAKSFRVERGQKIALSGVKQSRRASIPIINEPVAFQALLRKTGKLDIKLLAHEKETNQTLESVLNDARKNSRTAMLCIGPEGGFSDEEIAIAHTAGFSIVRMGSRRLRTETAVLVGATLLLQRFGEYT